MPQDWGAGFERVMNLYPHIHNKYEVVTGYASVGRWRNSIRVESHPNGTLSLRQR